jgi:dihydroxyacid dehydratase/phosphogluconate dehydratase
MAMARLNRPSLMIYGGTIKPGHSQLTNGTLDIVSAFQSYGMQRFVLCVCVWGGQAARASLNNSCARICRNTRCSLHLSARSQAYSPSHGLGQL